MYWGALCATPPTLPFVLVLFYVYFISVLFFRGVALRYSHVWLYPNVYLVAGVLL